MKRSLRSRLALLLPAGIMILSSLAAGCGKDDPEEPAPAGCGTPTGLGAPAVTSGSATLNWTAVRGAISYTVRYKKSSETAWTTTTSSSNSKLISGLSASTSYNFQVQTVCSGDSSAFSPTASFTTASASACGEGTVSYAANVAPIIAARCATSGCHNAGSTRGPGALTTYSQVFNARNNIRSAVSSGIMPPGGLPPADKQAILCWIDSGAPNN